jgi:thymidine kinase
MFSGKTTHLLELYAMYQASGTSVMAINYSGDTRYHTSLLSTHDKQMIPCVFASTITEVIDQFATTGETPQCILINEGQFFPDIVEGVRTLIDEFNCKVHVCGLDGDFRRRTFGKLLDLIPYCDTVQKLRATCNDCTSPAIFSHRLSSESTQVVIGSSNYVPLCRQCYGARTIEVGLGKSSAMVEV